MISPYVPSLDSDLSPSSSAPPGQVSSGEGEGFRARELPAPSGEKGDAGGANG